MRRKNSLLLAATTAVLLLLLSATTTISVLPVRAHKVGYVYQAWAPTPPTINGEIVDSEWQQAASSSFTVSIGGNPYAGTFYVMNDATNLYIAIKIADDDFNTGAQPDGVMIYFDNDNDGTYESGEDSIEQSAGATGFLDRFLDSFPTVKRDTDAAGGTNDGSGACAAHGGYNHFELSHPLNSADDAHDFSLSLLNTVGFTIGCRDGPVIIDGVGSWPASATPVLTPDATGWGDIVVASTPPTLSAWAEVAPTINGLIDLTEWSGAATAPIVIGWTFAGTLYVMNDATNLYMGVKIADTALNSNDYLVVLFDNDNDGVGKEVGEDLLQISGASVFYDLFSAPSTTPDTNAGGTADGDGKAVYSGGYNYFELKHPLDSTDNAHDFSLSAGDTAGFSVQYVEASGYWGDWPSKNPKSWAHITVASAPAPAPDFQIASEPTSISLAQGGSSSSTIKVQSLNGFSSAVALSWSWLGAAPSGVTVDLPSPITPPADGLGTATLTVTAAGTATTGDYTLTVTGVSGALTHTVDVTISISAAATTTTTTTTPTTTATTTATTTPTTTTTPSPTPPPGGCLVATATYGSELSPEVQFLRGFRDRQVLSTFAGSQFMNAFNAWYYSFSPSVASFIGDHPVVRVAMKILLYPLVGILHLSASAYTVFSFNPELAVCIAGLLASGLIGIVYFSPFALAAVAVLRKTRRGSLSIRNVVPLSYVWAASVGFLTLSILMLSPAAMMFSSATFVLTTIALTSLSTALRILQRFP